MSGSKLDFAFDGRVSSQYNTQRGHPPEVSASIGQAIADVVGDGSRILELGVGTGRIAMPVSAAGCTVIGVDVSARMLAECRRADMYPDAPVGLIQADITNLPFQPRSFDGVMATHVLHLVADWKQALAGAARSLRDPGYMVLGRDSIDPASMAGQLQSHFRRVVVELMGPQLKAPTGGQTIAGAIQELGGEPVAVGDQEIVAAEWATSDRPADIIQAISDRTYAESWVLPDELLDPVTDRMREFAAEQWAGLDTPQPTPRRFLLTVFKGGF